MVALPRVFLAAAVIEAGRGGICRVARLMAKVLALEAQDRNLLSSGIALEDSRTPIELGIPVRTFGQNRIRFCARTYLAALTHTHFVYDSVNIARAHCLVPLLRRPFLTMVHGIEIWNTKTDLRAMWARRARVLLANSAFTRERASQLHRGLEHARVCWLATEEDTPVPPRVAPPTRACVTIVARLDAEGGYKGHRELIEAWPLIRSAVPHAILRIVGDGPGRAVLESLVRSGAAASSIEFLGHVPENAMPGIWAETSIFAMPSRGEGFGLAYIEAMRYGVPVIASVHDAGSEVNLDGETGYSVDLERRNELPERIIHLLRNEDLANAMGEAGRKRWQTHFRFSAFRERFTPWLRDLVK